MVIQRKQTMVSILVFAISCMASVAAAAQSMTGITGVPDTSYTTYSAYNSNKKAFPFIAIVPPLKSPLVREKKGLFYCTMGNRRLVVDAFYPSRKSPQKRIAIVFLHGGGWRSGSRSQHYPLAQHLAALGYVCFTPEYRLSTEALYPAAVNDVRAALRWVKAVAERFGIDTAKLVVAGFSAGGELAAFVATTQTEYSPTTNDCHTNKSRTVAALIDIDGTLSFTNAASGEGDDSKRTSAATFWFGYPKKDSLALWEAASPLAHVSAATPPTLFINSGLDRMHAGRDSFTTVLAKYGVYAEVQTFAGAPHSFPLFEPWFTPMVAYMDGFLKKVFAK